ncbi:MAG: galactokinase family protein [Actinomycetota bacterium]
MGEQLLVRAPGRVNLIGDHTDYTGGLVFPMSIDRWTDISFTADADRITLSSADDSQPVDLAVAGTEDPRSVPGWGRYIAAVRNEFAPERGCRGSVATTIPVGSGLSSSAALEAAAAIALGFEGTPLELAQGCQRAEHAATGVPTGIMDQLCIAASVEGAATMIDCESLVVTPVPMPTDVAVVVRFIAHRTLEGSEYETRVAECREAESVVGPLRKADADAVARIADPVIRRRAAHVVSENARVDAFAAALAAADFAEAGRIMTDGHASLRDLYEVSTPEMDAAVDELNAISGVFGARMTGGGFGGCVVALCDPEADVEGWWVKPVAGAALA